MMTPYRRPPGDYVALGVWIIVCACLWLWYLLAEWWHRKTEGSAPPVLAKRKEAP